MLFKILSFDQNYDPFNSITQKQDHSFIEFRFYKEFVFNSISVI